MSLTGAGLRNMKAVPNYSTVGAVCEVVDNAIQYLRNGKGTVSVNFITGDNNRVQHIIIADNGIGFQKDKDGVEIMDYCLWFGGGSNIGATSGLGKYGVGLPFSCCNQSSDYRIYSWRENGEIRTVGRRHADFGDAEAVVEEQSQRTAIGNIDRRVKKVCKDMFGNEDSGTIVFWKDCDNLEYVRAQTLINHVANGLERVYRKFLNGDLIIELNAWSEIGNFITKDLANSIVLEPFDPLFLNGNRLTAPHYNGAPSDEFYTNIERPLTIEYPEGMKHEFVFRASVAKEDVQHPGGTPGGSTPLGRIYARHMGISLMRENRELDMNFFGFFGGSKSSDPRIRWYKGELNFGAVSDKLLGVGADKSRAVSFKYTDDDHWDSEDPKSELMHKLSHLIRDVIKEMDEIVKNRAKLIKQRAKGIKCYKCEKGTLIEGKCDNVECGLEVEQCRKCGSVLESDGRCLACLVKTPTLCPVHSQPYNKDGYCVMCGAPEELTDEEKQELLSVLNIYEDFRNISEAQVNNLMQWFLLSGKKHFLLFLPNKLNPHEFISYKKFDHSEVIFVLINKEHPFYTINIEPLVINDEDREDFDEALSSMIMLFINWARTENEMIDSESAISLFRSKFGTNLSAVMQNWPNS